MSWLCYFHPPLFNCKTLIFWKVVLSFFFLFFPATLVDISINYYPVQYSILFCSKLWLSRRKMKLFSPLECENFPMVHHFQFAFCCSILQRLYSLLRQNFWFKTAVPENALNKRYQCNFYIWNLCNGCSTTLLSNILDLLNNIMIKVSKLPFLHTGYFHFVEEQLEIWDASSGNWICAGHLSIQISSEPFKCIHSLQTS